MSSKRLSQGPILKRVTDLTFTIIKNIKIIENFPPNKKDRLVYKNNGSLSSFLPLVLAATLWSCNYHRQKSREPKINENHSMGENASLEQGYLELYHRLFKPYCLSCHHSGQPSAGVNLETFEALVKSRGSRSKLPILVTGNPQKSSLLTTIVKGEMPPGPKKPGSELVELLAAWIKGEASNEAKASAGKGGSSEEKAPQHEPPEASGASVPPQESPDLTKPPILSVPQPAVSFAEVQNKVIADHCIFCHEENYASGEIYLATLTDLLSSPGVGKDPLVRPGDLKNSLFYQSMIRTENRMPPGDEPLPKELTDLVKNWIETGAAP